jgi:hypothetical protein
VFPARKHLPLRVRLFVDLLKSEFTAPPLAGLLGGVIAADSATAEPKANRKSRAVG